MKGATWLWKPEGCGDAKVSIHAPVKGATFLVEKFYVWKDVSIHAPVKGATP